MTDGTLSHLPPPPFARKDELGNCTTFQSSVVRWTGGLGPAPRPISQESICWSAEPQRTKTSDSSRTAIVPWPWIPPSCPPTSNTNRRHAEGLRSLEDDATDRSDSGLRRGFSSSSDGTSDSIRRFNSKMGYTLTSPTGMRSPNAMDTLRPPACHHSTFVSPVCSG